jgi:3-deoxy-7-phosphoheptulonate synthase
MKFFMSDLLGFPTGQVPGMYVVAGFSGSACKEKEPYPPVDVAVLQVALCDILISIIHGKVGMIYTFESADPARELFLELLQRNEVDYEQVRGDRAVIRVFGNLEPTENDKLGLIYASRQNGLTADQATTGVEDVLFDQFGAGNRLQLIAGPCSVESETQIQQVIEFLLASGVSLLRAGAFKPRTSPGSFQGLGKKGLQILTRLARQAGLKVVTEIMDRSQLDIVCRCADIVQVGSRNMSNYSLLTALGAINKPVLLKRGMAATVDEWVQAADYIRQGGNHRVILCERGIRTFEPRTRFTLDIAAIPLAQKLSGLPVIADPSHAAGHSDLVPPLALAAAAAGADGLMIEIHPDPPAARSDRNQVLSFNRFKQLMTDLSERQLLR